MWENDSFKARGRHDDLQNIPIDGTHHHPHMEGVSHPLRNLVIHFNLFHDLIGLSNILRLLTWCALLWVKSYIYFYLSPLTLLFYFIYSFL